MITGAGSVDILSGGDGNDTLVGMAGDDALDGGNGDDTLNGGTGADSMKGGAGNDTFYVDNAIGDAVDDSAGIDKVFASVSYLLGATIENLTLTGSANLTGNGNALANNMIGNDGNNTLSGGAGNDTLNGGAGNDSMTGGDGNDSYFVDSEGDTVVETNTAVAGGIDTVTSLVNFNLGNPNMGGVENLTLVGMSATGTGNGLNNTIIGNNGLNIIDGGAGNDTMKGGGGDDNYTVDSTSDVVTENLNEGSDTVYSSATFTLSANVEYLNLTSGANINGTGNITDNVINGNNGNNVLSGLAGNDNLYGGYGNDTLDGGDGNDTLNGGGDTDLLKGGAGNDRYTIGATDTISGETGGVDLIRYYGTTGFALGDATKGGGSVENLRIYSANAGVTFTGTAVANNMIDYSSNGITLNGDAGDDRLSDGQYGYGGGDDILIGGLGNDTFDSWSLSSGDKFIGGTAFDAANNAANGIADVLNVHLPQTEFGRTDVLRSYGVETLNIDVTEPYSEPYGMGAIGFGVSVIDLDLATGISQINLKYFDQGNYPYNGANFSLLNVDDGMHIDAAGFLGNLRVESIADPATSSLNLALNDSDVVLASNYGSSAAFDQINVSVAGPNNNYLNLISVTGLTTVSGDGDIEVTNVGAGLAADSITLQHFSGDARLYSAYAVSNLTINLDDVSGSLSAHGSGPNLTQLTLNTTGAGGDSMVNVNSTNVNNIVVQGSLEGGQNLDLLNVQGSVDASTFGKSLFVVAGGGTLNAFGGSGDDTMVGSSGGDILQGGSGSDVLTGGGGNDSFVFGSSADLGADRITDFLGVSQMGGDKIYFGSFSGLSFGMHLNSNLFFSGTMDDFAASGAGERVIFDQSLGNLYYDSDGAAGSTKLVAHFDGGANVVADDILQSS